MATLFTSQPMALQTAFSELKRQALEQRLLLIGSPGSLVTRSVRDGRFVYRDYYGPEGKKAGDYVGPATDATTGARADELKEQIRLANALLKEARLLAQHGYVRVDARTDAILAALANNGLFGAGAVLVGSHAYGALLNDLGVRAAAMGTEDIDVARDRALHFEDTTKPFEAMLRDSRVKLLPVPALGRKAASTSFKAPGQDRLRVDLLVPTEGSEIEIREARDLGAHATAIPWLRYLLREPLPALVIGRSAMIPVRVPRPERFAWHKMLVSDQRHETSDKRRKDVEQAAVLVAALAEQAPESLEAAYASVPRSAKEKTRRGARRVLARLEQTSHESAVDVMRGLLAR